jgi:hypothetical protein
MLFSVVRLTATAMDGADAVGTGFFFSCEAPGRPFECLVTNKHVIEGSESIAFYLHGAATGTPQYANLGTQTLYTSKASDWIHHSEPDVDLCCLPVSTFLPDSKRHAAFYLPIPNTSIPSQEELEEFPASIGVAMIGYPNGLWDEINGLPIIRHGSTASHPGVPFNADEKVVVDIACFPGSSGSPIMFSEPRFFASAQKFLGVLYAGPTIDVEGKVLVASIPTTSTSKTLVQTMMHLGFVISAKKVQELAELAQAQVVT